MNDPDEYAYQKAYFRPRHNPTTNCGGWGSYDGPCGSPDCRSCYPGSAQEYVDSLDEEDEE
jgi:hypothetical protein